MAWIDHPNVQHTDLTIEENHDSVPEKFIMQLLGQSVVTSEPTRISPFF